MLQCCVRWQQCLHRTRPFCCKFSPFHKYSFSSENGFSVFPFWGKSASLNCVFESSLPSHTNTHWWEYVHTGIQHRDLIVIKNLRFHPSTRIQQIDINFSKNLHSGENFWKDAFSLNAVFTGYVWTPSYAGTVGQTGEEISAFMQKRIRVSGYLVKGRLSTCVSGLP